MPNLKQITIIILLILAGSVLLNISGYIEKKLEAKYQEGYQAGLEQCKIEVWAGLSNQFKTVRQSFLDVFKGSLWGICCW